MEEIYSLLKNRKIDFKKLLKYGFVKKENQYEYKTTLIQNEFDIILIFDKQLENTENLKIPTKLVPKCPVCGGNMEMNLRKDANFVQDENWYKQADKYDKFLDDAKNKKNEILTFENMCFIMREDKEVIMKYVYNKLVRDKIPEEINKKGDRKANYRILNDKEYIEELDKKLFEEAHEFVEEHSVEELADLMEVIGAIMKIKDISLEDVQKEREIKNYKKGKFENRIFLIDVEQEYADEREEKELNKEWRKK